MDLPYLDFRLIVYYQTCVDTPLPEVHLPDDPGSDLSGPTDTQRLCEDAVDEGEGTFRVTGPPEYPLLFRIQDGHEPTPYCDRGRGVPSSQLRGYLTPMSLSDSVVHDPPIQVRPVVVMRELSIDSLQQ